MDYIVAAGLNDEQMLAINHPGSVFLTACPGSGKTKTLTYKIAEELRKITSHRDFVVAITYTHRAADEILERVENLGLNTDQLWIGTIHSFCLEWIIRPYAIYEQRLQYGFTIINQPDADALLDEICVGLGKPRITSFDCGYYFKDGKATPLSSDINKHESIRLALGKYFRVLKSERKIDFELILYFAHNLIKNYPAIATGLSNLFRIILVDEYQDTKEIQYLIICAIFEAGRGRTDAFVVGDPNQSIFKTLGGYPIEFNKFVELSKLNVSEFSLSKNYRSSSKIVEYFSHFSVFPAAITPFAASRDYPSIISYNKSVDVGFLEDEIVRLITHSLENLKVSQDQICIVGPQWPSLARLTRRLMSRLPQCSFDGPGMIPFGRELDNFWYKLSRICLSEPAPEMYIRRLRWAGEVLSALHEEGVKCLCSKSQLLKELNRIEIDEENGMRYLEIYFSRFLDLLEVDIDCCNGLKNHYESFFDNATKKYSVQRKRVTI